MINKISEPQKKFDIQYFIEIFHEKVIQWSSNKN